MNMSFLPCRVGQGVVGIGIAIWMHKMKLNLRLKKLSLTGRMLIYILVDLNMPPVTYCIAVFGISF
ncbi:hypothetical protein D9M68_547400 [compost metagenome]